MSHVTLSHVTFSNADVTFDHFLETLNMETLMQCLHRGSILTQQQTLLVINQVCYFYPVSSVLILWFRGHS